jgi:prophage regulatory protein
MDVKSPATKDFDNSSRLERLPFVKQRTGLSRSEIYRQIKIGAFPAPVKLGLRSSAWVSIEITNWINHRIVLRGASND